MYTIALKTDSTLWSWGDNNVGQLGNGSTGNTNIPNQIGMNSKWSHISSGSAFSLAIRADSALFGWGLNQFGQLGIGSTTTQTIPVQVGIENNWVAIGTAEGSINNGAVDGFHTLALKVTGTVICGAGTNTSGQIGDSTNTNITTLSCQSGSLLSISESLQKKRNPLIIYPNPTFGTIHYEMSSITDYIIRINDISGKKIREITVKNKLGTIEIDGKAGIYFLEILDSKGNRFVQKLVKVAD